MRRILAFTITTDKSSTRLNASTSNIPPRVHAINQRDTRIASRRAFVTPAHADNEERVFASTFVFCRITQLLAVLSLLFLANPSSDLIVTKYNANVSIANISLDAEQLTPYGCRAVSGRISYQEFAHAVWDHTISPIVQGISDTVAQIR